MPQSKAGRVKAAKLGWDRKRAAAAARSRAAKLGWERRRRDEEWRQWREARRRVERSRAAKLGWERRRAAARVRAAEPRPLRQRLSIEEVRDALDDAVFAALTGKLERALDDADELLKDAPPGLLISIRVQYDRADGTIAWVSLTPLTPLENLRIILLAATERGAGVLTEGYWHDIAGVSIPGKLDHVETYIKGAPPRA